MSEIKITQTNFEDEVLKSALPVLVDFWAPWCPPCRMLAPIIKQIAEEKEGVLTVGKINVDEEKELAARFNVESIPTLIVFKNGEPVRKSLGFQPQQSIEAMLK